LGKIYEGGRESNRLMISIRRHENKTHAQTVREIAKGTFIARRTIVPVVTIRAGRNR
jgi:hypothetical protein